jgi:hypothetical protein
MSTHIANTGHDAKVNKSSAETSTTRLSGRRLTVARMIFFGLTGLMILVGIASFGVFFAHDSRVICTGTDIECQVKLQYSANQVADFERRGISFETMLALRYSALVISSGVSLAIGLFIAASRSDDWMAMLVALFLIGNGTMISNSGVSSALARAVPTLSGPLVFLNILSVVLFFLVLGLFPNGKILPPWMRWLLPLWCVIIAAITSIPPPESPPIWISLVSILGAFSTVLIAQAMRYHRYSTLIERQQTKWAVVGIVLFLITEMTFGLLFSLNAFGDNALFRAIAGMLGFTLLPFLFISVSIGISILRYRLWDIDVIIRRTLVYGALTLTLALVYFGSVILLQSLVTAVGGQQSAVVTVISTLLIAALFTRLRRRIQNDIDWRFYRKKYDAEKTIAAFSAGLRQEVDLEQIGERLLAVVEETMQPESVSLWLRPGNTRGKSEIS